MDNSSREQKEGKEKKRGKSKRRKYGKEIMALFYTILFFILGVRTLH